MAGGDPDADLLDGALAGDRAAFGRLLERSEGARGLGEGLQAALELWAYVQSRPEPTRAIVGFGKIAMRPHNVPLTMIGAGLLWFGWFGFNAGSELAADGTAARAWVRPAPAPC